jgi:transcriptional regulator with XRE-family HTH domain
MGLRLQEERKRLGLNQEDFSRLIGVSRRTQVSYESRDMNAGLQYLTKAQALGLDIYYIICGKTVKIDQQPLSASEADLLKVYRSLDQQDKESLMIISQSLAKDTSPLP